MSKARLMQEYKDLYGGYYERTDGKWFWKETLNSTPVLVRSGFLNTKILEAKSNKVEPISFKKVEVKTEVELNKSKKPQTVKKKTVKAKETIEPENQE